MKQIMMKIEPEGNFKMKYTIFFRVQNIAKLAISMKHGEAEFNNYLITWCELIYKNLLA